MHTDQIIGKPNALKQVNLSVVRKVIIENGSLLSLFGKDRIHRLFALMQGKRLGFLGLLFASLLVNSFGLTASV